MYLCVHLFHKGKEIMKGNFFYKRLGERIVKKRRFLEMSQEQLAMMSAIDRTYLARIERGRANPSIKVLNKLCRVLGTRLAILLEGV